MCSPDLFTAIGSVSQMVKEDATLFERTLALQAADLNSEHTPFKMQTRNICLERKEPALK